jgi:hypothetical protein
MSHTDVVFGLLWRPPGALATPSTVFQWGNGFSLSAEDEILGFKQGKTCVILI